jgi:uncharacterized protein (DUF2252 family)
MTTAGSPAERAAQGRALRDAVPRSSHGTYAPPSHRADPVGILEQEGQERVPELLPIRYERMLRSPFSFYRGAASLMAADLAAGPRTGIEVQCCGDAHAANFGVFASPERRLVFDINDFDETLRGPWEWDVKRLAASLQIAASENGHAPAAREQTVLETVATYRLQMRKLAAQGHLDVWYSEIEVDALSAFLDPERDPRTAKQASKAVAKARTRDSRDAMTRLTQLVDGHPRIAAEPPLIVPLRDLVAGERASIEEGLLTLFAAYASSLEYDRRVLLEGFSPVDFARKVVGVGSVGTRAWIALLVGRDEQDPLFLQIKEAQRSALETFLGPSGFTNAGERIVSGQRVMQATSDIFLGWLRNPQDLDGRPRDFYVRQLRDWKGSAVIEKMAPRTLASYGRLCAVALARAHARSGDRIAIASYLGSGDTFDRAIVSFGEAYAEQNRLDHGALAAAVASGRVTAAAERS